MSAASWFRLSKSALTTILSRSVRREPSRRPTHSRPSLEYLEERVVPDGASGNLGIVNNAAINFQGGITLVPIPSSADLSGIAVGVFTSPLNASGALLLAQQGLGLPSNLPNFTQTAFGFGSGTQPTQPWVPNAYNLGLANQQSAFPSMADRGFQAPAPWLRQIAHRGEHLDADDEGAPPHTFLAVKDFMSDEQQTDEIPVDEDAVGPVEEQVVPRSDPETPSVPDAPNAALEMEREEIAVKLFLPTSKPDNPEAVTSRFARTHTALPGEEDSLRANEDTKEVPPLHSLNLPSTLLLTVLTPAQLTALVMEFPVFAASRDDRAKGERLKESA